MNFKFDLSKIRKVTVKYYKDFIIQIASMLGILISVFRLFRVVRSPIEKSIFNVFITNDLLIILSIVFINVYINKNKKKSKKLEVENESLNEQHDKVRCFKHDFVNIMQSISGFISLKDMDSLQEYFKSIANECNLVNVSESITDKVKDNPAISSVLLNKYKVAKQRNIKMNINVHTNLSMVKGKSYMISRMLGILIDNAIDACEDSKDRVINIKIENEKISKKFLINIENTYNNKKVDLIKIYEKEYSTKFGNTGLGLWKVKDFLNRSKSIRLYTSKDDNMFKQQLEICA